MFNTNIFGNDDDIFDDSKSLSDNLQSDNNFNISSSSNRKGDFTKAMDSVLDVLNRLIQNKDADPEEARQLVRHLKNDHGIELNDFLALFRIKLASTILAGAGSWIESYQAYTIPRSVVYSLDIFSENKFTLVDKFFNLELENAKRIVISRFLQDVFLSRIEEKTNTLNEIFNAGLDSRYIKMYYQSLYDINMLTIWQNNGVYAALGQELDLPCNQKLLNCEEVMIDDLTSRKYIENKFSSILSPSLKERIGDSVAEYTSKYIDYANKKNL